MGGIKVATLYAALVLDSKQFTSGLNTAQANTGGFTGAVKGAVGGLTSFLTSPAGMIGAATAVVAFGAAALGAADEAQRALQTVEATFGSASSTIVDASDRMLQQWGVADEEFQLATTSLGDWAIAQGMSQEAAAQMSAEMGELAAQIAVAKDIPFAEAMDLVTKATQGGSRAARSLGVDISGMTTAQERANAILEDTANLQQVANERQDSMAVTSARVGARMGEAMEKVGGAIMKIADVVLPVLMAAFDALWPVVEFAIDIIVTWIQNFMGVVQAVWGVVGPIVEKIIGVFQNLGSAVSAVFRGVMSAVKGAVNFVIGIINGFIGLINKIQIHIPKIGIGPLAVGPFDWWGLRLGTIPYLAKGARGFPGGLAVVGEQGPELVNLPRGSDVFSSSDSRAMMGGTQNHINLTVEGIVQARNSYEILRQLRRASRFLPFDTPAMRTR